MTRRSVGVIVPCYRYASVLEGCVQSVLAQQGVDVRVLIADDCSPDETPLVGRRLAQGDDRVTYRRSPENQGLIPTANDGLAWGVEHDYVVLLSADDLLVPGALERAVQVMEERPRVGMVYGHALYAHAGRPFPVPSGRWRATDVWSGADWIRRRCRSAQNCISSPEVVVRASVARAVGGYDPSCFHTSDLNMWLRTAAVSDIAYVRGTPQAIYRIHADSMLRSDAGPLVDLRERQAAFDSFFAACGERLDGAEELQALAGRALARQALWRASRAIDRGLLDGPDRVPVDELVAFARNVHPGAERLREWHGLKLRRQLGAGRSRWFPPFVATGAAHRARGQLVHWRWRTRGI